MNNKFLTVLLFICLFISFKYSFSYYVSNYESKSVFKTKSYEYFVDLDGGYLGGNASISNDSFIIGSPCKDGYKFSNWKINGNSYTAVYTKETFSVNITSTIQDILYENGLASFTYDVYLNDTLVANDVISYKNDGVEIGSKVRVVVNERDGYVIKSDKDKTYTVESDLSLNVCWSDETPPVVSDLKIEILSHSGNYWNVKVTVIASDKGSGIKDYFQYIIILNVFNSQVHEYSKVSSLYNGKKWYAYVVDNAGNKSNVFCKTFFATD